MPKIQGLNAFGNDTAPVVESARGITLSTCVTLLVPEADRAKSNGKNCICSSKPA